MMLFISDLQSDALLRSPLQAVTLAVTVLLLLLLRVQRGRIGATSVPQETLAWIHDIKIRPTLAQPTRACLESLDWIHRLRLSRTALRLTSASVVTATVGESAPVVEQRDGAHDRHEPGDAHPHDDVRVLRLHVKSLEAALGEQIERVRELAAQPQAPARPVQDLAAVQATIQGLRTSMALDPTALRVLDRVEAAVCRLGGASDDLARPILPAAPSPATTRTDRAPVGEAHTIALASDAGVMGDEPAADITSGEVTAVEVPRAPVMAVPDHLVQPIPAPKPAPSSTSRRRWVRRLAA